MQLRRYCEILKKCHVVLKSRLWRLLSSWQTHYDKPSTNIWNYWPVAIGIMNLLSVAVKRYSPMSYICARINSSSYNWTTKMFVSKINETFPDCIFICKMNSIKARKNVKFRSKGKMASFTRVHERVYSSINGFDLES